MQINIPFCFFYFFVLSIYVLFFLFFFFFDISNVIFDIIDLITYFLEVFLVLLLFNQYFSLDVINIVESLIRLTEISVTLHNRRFASRALLVFHSGGAVLLIHISVQPNNFKRMFTRQLDKSGIFIFFIPEENCESFIFWVALSANFGTVFTTKAHTLMAACQELIARQITRFSITRFKTQICAILAMRTTV